MTIYALDGNSPELPEKGRYWVAPSAAVIGKVTLREDTSIWFGAVLRGDNERITVGRGSNVQENCVFHTDLGFPMTIGEDCVIGHLAMLHGCTIGDGSLVGMGAIVLNGAVIGKNVLIGANAVVAEGKIIPDNSLVLGSPGRVVRELTDEQAASLRKGAKHYVKRSQLFARTMTVVEE
ncbi:MAG: gamma carbonic anhydrase family protein [Rhodobiaceae bacterium]|nr:gamma carbonic anhydrase family protein [Rhodobiaceae bacterium]MCC0055948.1 gamma carbonic anhydrase family protein [Rhodobiaceae bacterium]